MLKLQNLSVKLNALKPENGDKAFFQVHLALPELLLKAIFQLSTVAER